MSIDITFKEVCNFIKKDDQGLIDTVDKLLGFCIVCSPMVLGPVAAALLPLISVKNELVKICKSLHTSLTNKMDSDYVARQRRMQICYALIPFTAFFEALDRSIPKLLREQFKLLSQEKVQLAKSAQSKVQSDGSSNNSFEGGLLASPHASFTIAFPHPTENLTQQVERHAQLWKQMSQGFREFVQKLPFWEKANEKGQAALFAGLEKVPQLAAECFESQYFELARRFEDFAVWSNLYEHKKTKELIGSLSEYVQKHSTLSKSIKATIDIGLSQMHEVVMSMPETLKVTQATEIVESLRTHYNHRIADPIAEEKDEPQSDKPRLHFPRVCDAFVPQSFRVLRQGTKITRLEDEGTWSGLERRDDLGSFLLSYLSSPYSTETPFVILGHPGSGKSLLSTVLSAQLMSKHYAAIRVPLREVDAEAGIVAQVEETIRRITNISVDSWAKLSGAFKNNPPLVILDGYDELLQASGKVFSGYLKDVQTFQKNESEQGRPVRVIVTSRITLIDKATIPPGSTIMRLLEFDKRQRESWISIWNSENATYFKQTKIKEFSLPKDDQNGSAKILSLAEQPLLLLMLALYDSQDNRLRKSKTLDRTFLYDSLLRRFVARERAKDKAFEELSQPDKKKELDREMQRLAVAALGMYNRRKLHILTPELNDDIKFFSLERPVSVSTGRPLSQADLLLGSFFFVHKSKAQLKGGTPEHHEETAAFEFLHNTFGEFLTADFVLRQTVAEVAALKALRENEVLRAQLDQRLGNADGLSRAWFASLVYTPLFTRPVVLEMMREWIAHTLKKNSLSTTEFLSQLDTIVMNQIRRLLNKREMPSIIRKETAQEGYRAPFGDHPLLGHIAIYTINLMLLRIIVGDEPFVFDENQIGTHEDGARPWDRLTHIWRSWFSLDILNGITAIMTAQRNETRINITAKQRFQVAESQSRLATFANVAIALGDNISSGLTCLLSFDPSKENPLQLDEISHCLSAEKIDLEFQIVMKRLYQNERQIAAESIGALCQTVRQAYELALRGEKYEELEHISSSLRRTIRRLSHKSRGEMGISRGAFELFRNSVDPKIAGEIAMRNPQAAVTLYRTAREVPDIEWSNSFRRDFVEYAFHHRHPMELMERDPEAMLAWLQLVREIEGGHMLARVGGKFLHPEFLERIFDPRYLLELTERSPDTALTWLQVARELSGSRFFERFDDKFLNSELFQRMLDPHYLLELSQRNPETALEWLQLVREFTGPRFREFVDKTSMKSEFIERIFDPQYLVGLSENNPELALSWLQLLTELNGMHFRDRVISDILGQVFDPRYFLHLTDRDPKTALAGLRLAREAGADRFLKNLDEEFFGRFFDPFVLTRLLYQNPLAFAIALSLARITKSKRAADAIVECLRSSMRDYPTERSLLDSVPLAAIDDLRWLVETSGSEELNSLLKKLLDPHDLRAHGR